jgi:hypothetical protein
MKKRLISFYLLLIISSCSFAGGGIAHMYMAEKAISKLNDPQLQQLLLNNKEAYVVGAYYPDSGYIKPNTYGEDSHWEPFINTFVSYLKDKYQDPIKQNPKLVAFLFGIAAHHESDEITHWTFYPDIENHDCPGRQEEAHDLGDMGIDLLLTVDKSLWTTHPTSWWVPVKDLVAVYKRMGKEEYTAKQIIYGNAIIFLAGYGERAISAPSYLYLQWKMPWTANHYLNWPNGGMNMDEFKIAEYQNNLWLKLNDKTGKSLVDKKTHRLSEHADIGTYPTHSFAKEIMADGIVQLPETADADDGSVTLQTPLIANVTAFNAKIAQLTKAMIDKL